MAVTTKIRGGDERAYGPNKKTLNSTTFNPTDKKKDREYMQQEPGKV